MTRCEACHGAIGAHERPHWFGGTTRYHPGCCPACSRPATPSRRWTTTACGAASAWSWRGGSRGEPDGGSPPTAAVPPPPEDAGYGGTGGATGSPEKAPARRAEGSTPVPRQHDTDDDVVDAEIIDDDPPTCCGRRWRTRLPGGRPPRPGEAGEGDRHRGDGPAAPARRLRRPGRPEYAAPILARLATELAGGGMSEYSVNDR